MVAFIAMVLNITQTVSLTPLTNVTFSPLTNSLPRGRDVLVLVWI